MKRWQLGCSSRGAGPSALLAQPPQQRAEVLGLGHDERRSGATALRRRDYRALKAAGIAHLRFHNLRHTFGTMKQWRHLRERLAPASRWPSPHLAPFPIDTGCRGALITVEHGTEGVAANRARSRALLATAVWTLFETLPFRAMEATDRRSAQVLLSAAWSLFHARRSPSLLEATDRALYLSTALASLCEPAAGAAGGVLARWRVGLRDELYARGYTDPELDDAERRSYAVRNISAHGGDAVLVSLGYPADAIARSEASRHPRAPGRSPLSEDVNRSERVVRTLGHSYAGYNPSNA